METDPTFGVSVLTASSCWALLRATEVGRLAVWVDGHPAIFPINFIVDHGTILFRTAEGAKLAATIDAPEVAFEADGDDPAAAQAWSVVLRGHAEEVTKIPDLVDTMTLPLFPWQLGPKHRFVRLVPVEISGRRFAIASPAAWQTAMSTAPRAADE
jgi:hypothetical protein